MNMEELRQQVSVFDAPRGGLAIGELLFGHSEFYLGETADGRYEVCNFERGEKLDVHTFDTEEEACDYYWSEVCKSGLGRKSDRYRLPPESQGNAPEKRAYLVGETMRAHNAVAVELDRRLNGESGDGTVEQLESVEEELAELAETVKQDPLPPLSERTLSCIQHIEGDWSADWSHDELPRMTYLLFMLDRMYRNSGNL